MTFWRRKGSSPSREAVKFFAALESSREITYHTHQIVHLKGNGLGTGGLDLSAEERSELRRLLQASLQREEIAPPSTPLYGYRGFLLYDPFDDDRSGELDEIPHFAPPRKTSELYQVHQGVVQVGWDGPCRSAEELEEWLKRTWTVSGRDLRPDL